MEISKLVEVAVAERYAKKFKRAFFTVHGYFKDFDVGSLTGDVSLEVKMDTYSTSSGNVAVEYSYKGEPSGAAASTADSFVFVIPEGKDLHLMAYEVDARDLKAVLSKVGFVRGGDNYFSTMKLLSVERLKEIASDSFSIELNLGKLKEYWKR